MQTDKYYTKIESARNSLSVLLQCRWMRCQTQMGKANNSAVFALVQGNQHELSKQNRKEMVY